MFKRKLLFIFIILTSCFSYVLSSTVPESKFINETNISNFSAIGNVPEALQQDWLVLSFIALMITFVFAVILYLGYKIFNSNYLKAHAVNEFLEFLNSLIILILILGFITLLNGVFSDGNICPQPEGARVNCFVQQDRVALDRLDSGMQSFYINLMQQIADINADLGFSEGYGIDLLSLFLMEWNKNPGQNNAAIGTMPIKQKAMEHARNIYTFFLSFKTFFNKFLIPLSIILIPLGLFLRSLFFTRRLGATLLALGIAGYVVFPVLLNYLLYLAGFVEPSAPYAPSPSCPQACANPVPVVFNNTSGSPQKANITGLLKSAIPASGDPFSNDTYMSYYNLSLGTLASYNNYYSCDNLSWAPDLSNGVCPKPCRVIPYPIDNAVCRDYEYFCNELYKRTNGACFSELVYNPTNPITRTIVNDPDFLNLRVPVLKKGQVNGQDTITVEQKHPVIAAVENKCALLVPSKIPPNIPLKDYNGNALNDNIVRNEQGKNFTYFCPEIYRKVILDISDLNNIKLIKPTSELDLNNPSKKAIYDSCEEFYKQALPASSNLLWFSFIADVAALMNPGTPYYINALVRSDDTFNLTNTTTLSVPENYYINLYPNPNVLPPCDLNNASCGLKVNSSSPIYLSSCFVVYEDESAFYNVNLYYHNRTDYTLTLTDFAYLSCEKTCSNVFSSTATLSCNITLYKTNVSFYIDNYYRYSDFPFNVDGITRGEIAELNKNYTIATTGSYATTAYTVTSKSSSCSPSDITCISNESSRISRDYNLSIPVLVVGNCSNIAAVPSESLWLPPTIDCSKCVRLGFSPLTASLKSKTPEINAIAQAYVKSMIIPIIAIALTAVIVPGLSNYLGGELFIPAIEKLI